MTSNIKVIFDQNIKLLGDVDKSIYYFREQQYDKALSLLANSVDLIKSVIEEIISDREYFNLVDTESLLEMLTGILEAKKNKDFILLTDLLELQLLNFLIGVQELIISKEEIVFNEENYTNNLSLLLEHTSGLTKDLMEPINTSQLLESGYRIEFTSSGQMTLGAENNGTKFYFHTNNKVHTEAFLLANQWYQKDIKKYLIYGFGLGYHIQELQLLAADTEIEVYEADRNVLQLACAFTNMKEILSSHQVKIIYDPEMELLNERLQKILEEEKLQIHYPSYRNIKNEENKEMLQTHLPWSKLIEEI